MRMVLKPGGDAACDDCAVCVTIRVSVVVIRFSDDHGYQERECNDVRCALSVSVSLRV